MKTCDGIRFPHSGHRWLTSFTLRPLHLRGRRPSVPTEWDWAPKSVDTVVKIKGCAPSGNLIPLVQTVASYIIDWAVLAQFYLLKMMSEMVCGIFGACTARKLTWHSEWRKLLEYPVFCFSMPCSQYVFGLRLHFQLLTFSVRCYCLYSSCIPRLIFQMKNVQMDAMDMWVDLLPYYRWK